MLLKYKASDFDTSMMSPIIPTQSGLKLWTLSLIFIVYTWTMCFTGAVPAVSKFPS